MRIVLRPDRSIQHITSRNTNSTLLPSFIYWPRDWAKSAWDYVDENYISFGLHDQPFWLRGIMVIISISVAVYYFAFLHEGGAKGHEDFTQRMSELYHIMERLAIVAGVLGYFFRTRLNQPQKLGGDSDD